MAAAVHVLKTDPEFQALIVRLGSDALQRLEESIKQEGCHSPILVWNEVIVDGYHRYDICHRNNIPFHIKELDFPNRDAVKLWMINHQLGRRNLTSYQRSALVLKEKNILEGEAKERQGTRSDLATNNISPNSDESAGRTDEKLAKKAGVGKDTLRKVEKIEQEADEETKRKLRDGEVSVHKAYTELSTELPDDAEIESEEEEGPLELVGIKKAGAMNYVVMWSDGSANSVSRKTLLETGYKKCDNCSGYGVVVK